MLKKVKFFIGLAAFSLIVGFNVHHASNGYGVKDGKLHVEILAQDTGSGGTGSGSGSGTDSGGSNNSGSGNIYYYKHLLGAPKSCTLYKAVNSNGQIDYSGDGVGYGVGWTVTKVSGTEESCPKSGGGCTVFSCHVTNNTGGGT